MTNPFPKDKIHSFMELAIEEAREAEKEGEVPVGAVLVTEEGEILSKAHNCPISTSDPTGHAEIVAIRRAAKKILNYRLTNTALFVTLEPCIMCAGALVWTRVKYLFFGAKDPKSGAFGSVIDINNISNLNHRILVASGIMEETCGRLLKDFFLKRR